MNTVAKNVAEDGIRIQRLSVCLSMRRYAALNALSVNQLAVHAEPLSRLPCHSLGVVRTGDTAPVSEIDAT